MRPDNDIRVRRAFSVRAGIEETTVADKDANKPQADRPSADKLRMMMLEKQMEAMNRAQKAKEAEEKRRAAFVESFMGGHVSEEESAMIRRLVTNAAADGKMEAMVYSFPSELCTDSGRAINNGDPDWPSTLQGKARELFDRFKTVAQPEGYKLKAMIINFPGGMPGDVGFFLSWAPEAK